MTIHISYIANLFHDDFHRFMAQVLNPANYDSKMKIIALHKAGSVQCGDIQFSDMSAVVLNDTSILTSISVKTPMELLADNDFPIMPLRSLAQCLECPSDDASGTLPHRLEMDAKWRGPRFTELYYTADGILRLPMSFDKPGHDFLKNGHVIKSEHTAKHLCRVYLNKPTSSHEEVAVRQKALNLTALWRTIARIKAPQDPWLLDLEPSFPKKSLSYNK
jgi:hypothetical protein